MQTHLLDLNNLFLARSRGGGPVTCWYVTQCVCVIYRVKKVCFKTLVDEVQELEALSKDPGAVVHGKR